MGHGAASGVGPMPDAAFLKISGAKLEFIIFLFFGPPPFSNAEAHR